LVGRGGEMPFKRKSIIWLLLVAAAFSLGAQLHSEMKPGAAAVLIGICFACELVDSGLGMGYGTILTPTLLFLGYEPGDIVPTILVSELLSGFAAAFFHNDIRNVELNFRGRDFVPAIILAGGSVAGVTAGVLIAMSLPKVVLSMVIGCIIFTSGFFVILFSQRVIRYSRWKMLLLSTVASFNKAVSGGGYGPLVTSGQILSGVNSKASVGITSFAEAFTCLVAVTLFLVKGGLINWLILIPMCAGALSSVPFAVVAINRANDERLKLFIGVLTLSMGVVTIYKAMS
jgi:uncharacterized protein